MLLLSIEGERRCERDCCIPYVSLLYLELDLCRATIIPTSLYQHLTRTSIDVVLISCYPIVRRAKPITRIVVRSIRHGWLLLTS